MIDDIIRQYAPITLEEMTGIKLMNRTDTKFVTTVARLCDLLKLAADDYRVQDMSGERNIPYFTVYFDTLSFDMYSQHEHGHTNRQKLRIRSYVNSNLNFLEVKTKNNHGRTKKKRVEMVGFDPRHPQRDISFHRQDEQYEAYGDFLEHYLRYDAATVRQTIENNFNRITLVNKAKTERLTIDTGLRFHNLITGEDLSLDNIAIIELKRDGLQPSPILGLLNQLRIKPSGFSKYCMGSAMTNHDLHRNRFKQRLRYVDKLMKG